MMTEKERLNAAMQIYSHRVTLLSAFLSGQTMQIPHVGFRITEPAPGITVLKYYYTRIASWNGRIMSIHGRNNYGDCLSDALLREAARIFHGDSGKRFVKSVPTRWAYSWWGICYDRSAPICEIRYPFRVDLRDLVIILPDEFFRRFLEEEEIYHDCPNQLEILSRLKDRVLVPGRWTKRVGRRMLEMQLDLAVENQEDL